MRFIIMIISCIAVGFLVNWAMKATGVAPAPQPAPVAMPLPAVTYKWVRVPDIPEPGQDTDVGDTSGGVAGEE